MAGNGPGWLALQPLRRPLFVAAVVLYGVLQLATRWGRWQPPGWVAGWLADLLCMPVVLTLALAVQRAWRRQPRFTLPDGWLLAAWLYVSGWFELLAPLLRPERYTADWLDVLAYGIGTLAFRRWLNRP